MRKFCLIFITVFTTTIAACGGKKMEKASENIEEPKPLTELAKESGKGLPKNHPAIPSIHGMGSGHSASMTKITKPIKIPEEVVKTWKFAVIDIVDKSTGKTIKEFKVKANQTIKADKNLEIKVLYIVPHLVLDDGYTSASNEPLNPAVLIKVRSNKKTIFEGPIYQKFPNFYSINHPKYEVVLKKILKG